MRSQLFLRNNGGRALMVKNPLGVKQDRSLVYCIFFFVVYKSVLHLPTSKYLMKNEHLSGPMARHWHDAEIRLWEFLNYFSSLIVGFFFSYQKNVPRTRKFVNNFGIFQHQYTTFMGLPWRLTYTWNNRMQHLGFASFKQRLFFWQYIWVFQFIFVIHVDGW